MRASLTTRKAASQLAHNDMQRVLVLVDGDRYLRLSSGVRRRIESPGSLSRTASNNIKKRSKRNFAFSKPPQTNAPFLHNNMLESLE